MTKGNYRPISLMNITTEFLIKHLQTKFNNTLKRLYAMIKLVSFQGCKDDSTSTNQKNIQNINRMKNKNPMIILIHAPKAFKGMSSFHFYSIKCLKS
jgi:hypothetical protein